MHRIRAAARQFVRADDGIVPIEYGLLIALVAVVLAGALRVFSGHIAIWFSQRTDVITRA